MRNKSKNVKGITLTVLVITVTLILIISGAAITVTVGGNGLFGAADNGVGKWNASIKSEDSAIAEFENIVSPKKHYIKFLGMSDEVEVINSDESLVEYYGREVSSESFSSIEGIHWQLLYDDKDYVYILPSDYVPIDLLPNELIKETQGAGQTKYKAAFATYDSTNRSYVGPIMEQEPWNAGTASSTITNNPLTQKYLKWALENANSNNTNPSAKATAFMMDTSKWANFAGDSVEGAFAIGGATLELWVKSYNTKHDDKLSTYDRITTENSNFNGYYWKPETETSWRKYKLQGFSNNSQDNIWFIDSNNNKAYAEWIASPLTDYGSSTVNMHVAGSFAYSGDTYVSSIGCAFRPVVVLPKNSL
ncbi:MAG: hypothetical protein IKP28_04860 [Clostridia bacterium]|nr:hypothetical protein [Clostridia bacterium]